MSYRNVVYNGRNRSVNLFTWDTDGKRVMHECSFEPYLYLENLFVYEPRRWQYHMPQIDLSF